MRIRKLPDSTPGRIVRQPVMGKKDRFEAFAPAVLRVYRRDKEAFWGAAMAPFLSDRNLLSLWHTPDHGDPDQALGRFYAHLPTHYCRKEPAA